jgi:colanic acid/amylovoran biosynthesis glycosyltransferase
MTDRKIAYIMSRFPHLPETFILREMSMLEKLGWSVVLCPLIVQSSPLVHQDARAWVPRAERLPYLSRGVLAAVGRSFLSRPVVFLSLWGTVISSHWRQPRSLVRALALLPKMIFAATVLSRQGVTHVHAHYATYPALAAWVIQRLTGLPYSLTVHAHDLFMGTPMLEEKLGEARFVAAISAFNREFIRRHVGVDALDRTTVVHCGVTPSDYSLASPPPDGADQPLEILSVGSLQPYKGQIHLVRACRILVDRGINLQCRIVGGGPEQRNLEREIELQRLHGVVELLGPQPQEEVARLLPTAHCYVQPSVVAASGQMEGIPVSLMEALASGLPVIATDLSGVGELVRPGETGWLVPPEAPEAIADAVAELVADPVAAVHRAQAGRALVLEEFDLETNVQRLAQLLDETIATGRDGS